MTTSPRPPREVPVPAIAADRLETVIGPERLEAFLTNARRVQEVIDGSTIWNINSTAAGGGVAEMLRALLPWVRGAGVDARWLVIPGNPEFFRVTKRIHNRLYGFSGDGGPLGAWERTVYEQAQTQALAELRAVVRPDDVVILHDPQTIGMARALRALGARVVWRCHVGRDSANAYTDEGWSFVREYVSEAERAVFSRAGFAPSWLPAGAVHVIPPSLDPFSPKNQPLSPAAVRRILLHVGLLRGDPVGGEYPLFTRGDGSPGRVDRHADILQSGPPPSTDVPVVLQVSRWDRAKDMAGVMRAFAERIAPVTDAHLVLAGPSVCGVADDPEGAQVLQECMTAWQELPHEVRGRTHLACLPMQDLEENAVIVNALQRHATVVTQKSLAEGFGLTVLEAMWKARSVVGSAVGGICEQIVPDESGLLVPDATDLAAFAAAVIGLLGDPAQATQLGRAAERRVHEQFLGDTHLERWAQLVFDLAGLPPGLTRADNPPIPIPTQPEPFPERSAP